MIKAGNPKLWAMRIKTAHRLTRYDFHWALFKAAQRQASKAGIAIVSHHVVMRSGIQVDRYFQRRRWLDGTTLVDRARFRPGPR
jgi:hypothetical protein